MHISLSPDEEAKRLAALDKYHVLDSLPEQEYEDITQLAAQICGTPIALISLVDAQRQWFKAKKGLPVQQTPREQSFCAHNLVNPTGPLIVEDARLDQRFVHNPLVTGDPHIVFYAGIPLIDPQGHILGSLCVIDQQVRQLTPNQLEAINCLARQVMSLLKLRQTNQALQEAQRNIDRQRLDIDFALQAVGLGVWEVDQATNLVIWDDRCRTLFGIAKENPLPYEQAIRYIHPEDVKRVDQAVGWAVNPASGGVYDQTYRTIGADDGKLRWVRFYGQGYFTPDGQLNRFAGVAQDVTDQMVAQQEVRRTQLALNQAIEMAQMGTWTMEVATGAITLSDRLREWFGVYGEANMDMIFAPIHEADRQPLLEYVTQAMRYDSGGWYQTEYRVINQQTGQQRTLYTQGQTYFDDQQQPLRLVGTALDITQQRELEGELNRQVRLRTQDLERANQDLKRSNDNLQQFAYIASHDLQEPLRKIQAFSDLLAVQLEAQLDESSRTHLQRITAAGARMSTLIKDLLAFSRISTRQQTFSPVSLNAIVGGVLSVLDWEIQQTKAQVQVDELPVVNGDESQLGQLFQNLLTNALKFVLPGEQPRIHIEYFHRSLGDLPPEVRPNAKVPFYHQISVVDQGVGFDTKFRDRIFQVFQRLHGKNEYPGTGVGLAIVQRVVENHGGSITASSQPGKGATFCVYLPA